MDFDVIVVGARVAGASTAMLLARGGLRVLAVDRARFPSDTLSTHQVQLPGVALLRRWGVLEELIARGTPPARTVIFDAGPAVLRGAYPSFDGVDGVYSPRRTVLDARLIAAARAAGATVEENFIVEGLTRDGDRVTGLTGRFKNGRSTTLTAKLVIGADGKNSTVAKEVGAREYRKRPPASGVLYGYFAGLPLAGGEVYVRPDRMVTLWPTDDELTLVYVGMPAAKFAEARTAGLPRMARGIAGLGERIAAAQPAERVRGTIDVPGVIRRPYGPGWALVGDAGLVMDPITGQGIGNALRDADRLSRAILDGLALREYHRRRDAGRRPMYDLTARLAAFRPDPAGDTLFPALAEDPARVTRFLGMLTGINPVRDIFGPAALRRTVGLRGIARILLARRKS
ncbi:2-polyprenyl-6-methoxyphenol hydroxylase-like FAD-dependent oxidoreductase [Actinoplanes tereljensis]|uniref:FAD-dependent oxidoreductase n=1 Tax=Paractinoplanes tereljensis TaxID=571912 RepID=A0A919NNJ8_9ACTN|nr:NAD(P)/FAD-dependent oxidoreductase [Actinoplanes tereljensis]GIF20832.1 FAD-dependent oxidoreductase [Actinoplanes tereljensis]